MEQSKPDKESTPKAKQSTEAQAAAYQAFQTKGPKGLQEHMRKVREENRGKNPEQLQG